MRCINVLTFLALAAMMQGDKLPKARPDGDLQVRIVPSSFREKTGRAIELYRPSQHFHVVVTNVSKEHVRLWREWCSRGYFNVSFTVTDESGKTVTVKKRPRGWDKNYPDCSVIPPGGHMIFEISFDDTTWQGAPLPEPEMRQTRRVRMKAVYAVPVDPETKRDGIWTGEISSPEDEYTIYR
jgi:hypothetical protein